MADRQRSNHIAALRPDLILAFSDLQADIAAELARRGFNIVLFNQRSVAEILQMIRMLGGLIGRADAAEALAATLEERLDEIRGRASRFSARPRVYFEEWDDPLISGIQWVEELIEIAGGDPIFPELRHAKLAKDRIVQSDEVVRRRPDVIIASWCGKAVNKQKIASRIGWEALAAVRAGRIYEVKSALILQPGPAALTEGIRQLHEILAAS